jgi:acyl carrier protein
MDVSSRVREFIRGSFLVDEFKDDDSFLANGLIDSLGMMQLVSFVEGEFQLPVKDTDLVPENFDSVANIAAFVARARSRAA